jgi:hypothetical protein
MRVAIQNPFTGQFVAEVELSRRICLAATQLGWTAAEVHTAAEIKAFQPDFVIALHNNSPKLAEYPTYGCMWNPPSFFEGTEKFVKHVLSYDGYLTSSAMVDRWLHQLLYNTPKICFTAPFYTSCPKNQYQAPPLDSPQLVYLGSNWDGLRFQALFEQLDRQDYMAVYGNPEGWRHLHHSYQGTLPYDGTSVLQTLNRAGVGLCLHRQEHRQAALPSMRIFEIVASGAIAICGEHPFIREAFGDTVLYIDPEADPAQQVAQISQHMQWIGQHPQEAKALSAAAHAVFVQHFALEHLLLNLLPYHHTLVQVKGFESSLPDESLPNESLPSVQLILVDRGHEPMREAIAQLRHQTYPNLSLLWVHPQIQSAEAQSAEVQSPEALKPEALAGTIPCKRIAVGNAASQSAYFWAGLNAVDADYFAFVETTTLLHPNHLQTLVTLLHQHPASGVGYSGSLFTAPESNDSGTESPIAAFHPFNLEQLLAFEQWIPLSTLLIRRSLLDSVLLQDPELNDFSDLCLLLHLAQRTSFTFSYDITAEVDRSRSVDRSLRSEMQNWSSELSRLKFIFWHQEFAPGKTLKTIHQALPEQQLQTQIEALRLKLERLERELERSHIQLQEAEDTIDAMQSSKFWRLRSAWFKLKRAIGLPTDPT